jgi:hypothetical protein
MSFKKSYSQSALKRENLATYTTLSQVQFLAGDSEALQSRGCFKALQGLGRRYSLHDVE